MGDYSSLIGLTTVFITAAGSGVVKHLGVCRPIFSPSLPRPAPSNISLPP